MKLIRTLLFVPGIFASYPLALLKQSSLGQTAKGVEEGGLVTNAASSIRTATVQIKNNFPVGAWLTILHWRGSPREEHLDSKTFSNVSSGQVSDYMGVVFDSVRKDFDVWSVGVHFGNESLTLWTKNQEANLALDDAQSNSVFETEKWGGKVELSVPRSSALVSFEEPGSAHPAPDLNSFVFFTPLDSIKDLARFSIGLTNDATEHDINQTYTFNTYDPEPEYGYHFPFYFWPRSSQTWTISVHAFGDSFSGDLTANFTCNLEPENHGSWILVELNRDGYVFGTDLKRERSCRGKWENVTAISL